MPRRSLPVLALVLALLVPCACRKVDFTAREGATITVSANPSAIPSTGGQSTVTVTITEEDGTPTPDGTVVTFTTSLGSVTPRAETRGGVASAVLSANGASGVATVTAFSGAAGSETVDVTIGVEAGTLTLTATPAALPSGGGTTTLSSTVFGTNGQPVQGAAVVFSSTAGRLASGGAPVLTDASGRATDRLTTSTTAEVTATSGSQSRSLTVPVGTTGIDSLVLSANPASLDAGGGSSNLSAVVLGESGPIAGVPVAWSADSGRLTSGSLTTTDSSGVARNVLQTTVTTVVRAAAGSATDEVTVTVGATATDVNISVAGTRTLIPPACDIATLGTCSSTPGVLALPIVVRAQVTDDAGNPLPGRQVLFFQLPETCAPNTPCCSRAFGEFCGSGGTSVTDMTDALGIAEVQFALTQADLDFCNCLPSGTNCWGPQAGGGPAGCMLPMHTRGSDGSGLCPSPSQCVTGGSCVTGSSPQDLFCGVEIVAVTSGVESANTHIIEYGR